ncbi:MAG: hypothetical protein Q7K42_04370 [Candidatus Diapherotrites archaeon]|nr:hypothetical protein [Candidatus Diapherotrites archaeon]
MKKIQIFCLALGIIFLISSIYGAGSSSATKTYITSNFQIAKDFKACKLYKEYSNFKIPNIVVKIHQKNPNKTLYESHFGKVIHNGSICTLFYEKDSKYCNMYCIAPAKELVQKPPIPYPKLIPQSTLNKIVNKYSLHPNWPEKISGLNATFFG